MLYISEQARQNFPLVYNNKDTKAYIGEWLRQEGWRFKSSRLQEDKCQSNTIDYLFIY